MKTFALLPVLSSAVLFPASCAGTSVRSESSIDACRRVLERQAEAWNHGDLDEFMTGYRNSPETVFSGSSGSYLGWDGLRRRFRSAYPDGKAMGRLQFSELSFQELGAENILVLGRWQLEKEEDRPWGRFVLVFREFPEGWAIVLDYTTSEGG